MCSCEKWRIVIIYLIREYYPPSIYRHNVTNQYLIYVIHSKLKRKYILLAWWMAQNGLKWVSEWVYCRIYWSNWIAVHAHLEPIKRYTMSPTLNPNLFYFPHARCTIDSITVRILGLTPGHTDIRAHIDRKYVTLLHHWPSGHLKSPHSNEIEYCQCYGNVHVCLSSDTTIV